jgi:predicted phosphoribosyltransferase
MTFTDRSQAGRQLAAALAKFKSDKPIIFALPRGGIPIAAEVATVLGAPIDLILVRKIGVPDQPELAMGAVVDGREPITVRNDDVILMAGIDEATFQSVRDRELAEIERRRKNYLGDRPHPAVRGRTVIVVDDGIATGATVRAALRAMRLRKPSKLVLAVPVAPTDSIAELHEEADEIICLEDHQYFGAIGLYYSNFRQVSDQEVKDILARHPPTSTGDEKQPTA